MALATWSGFLSAPTTALAAIAEPEPTRPSLPANVRAGLWLTTEQPGLMIAAPTVHTIVEVSINGMIARVGVSQAFDNPGKAWAEGIYVFPLPEDAAVDHLIMTIGKRTVEGRIKPREEARETYERARAAGRRASLIEQERPNIFTTSVANIGPGERVEVRIEYQQTVAYDQGEFRLRFPMVVAPRYIPGGGIVHLVGGRRGTAPEDADRITPPVRRPEAGPANPVQITVVLNPGVPIKNVESPFHPIDVRRGGDGVYTIGLKQDGPTYADRDFELIWRPDIGRAPLVALFREAVGEAHYVHVMVLPPSGSPAAARRSAREVIFVIDTSGSMDGVSITQAKKALLLALERLTPKDRFNVIRFSSDASAVFDEPLAANARNVAVASGFVRGLEAAGGTEIIKALHLALDARERPERVRQVVFLTDGAIGNEVEAFELIRGRLGSSRLFTIGIGSAPNSYFMTKAAEFGRGTFTFIGDVDQVQTRMGALFEKLEKAVLTGLAITWPAGTTAEVLPRHLPDLYAGEAVSFAARVDRPDGVVRVSGRRGEEEWTASVDLGEARPAKGVSVVWAYAKIEALMDAMVLGADKDETRKQVVRVALAHHVVSPHTSLVAEDEEVARPEDAPVIGHEIPTNLPRGWDYDSVFGTPAGGFALQMAPPLLGAHSESIGKPSSGVLYALESAQTGLPGMREALGGFLALAFGLGLALWLWFGGRRSRP